MRGRRPSKVRATTAVGVLLMLVGSTSAAQPEPPELGQPLLQSATPTLGELVERLDAPDVQARIDATEQFCNSPSITLRQLEAALGSAHLTPEQRQRLNSAAFRRFRSEPRAAMGVGHDGNAARDGVGLSTVQPEFHAGKVLRVGDRIVEADGLPIDRWETIRAVILSRDPGDEIPLTIIRDGAALNVRVRLGDIRTLRTASADPEILAAAWKVRRRHQAEQAGPAPVAESGLPPGAWFHADPIYDDSPEFAAFNRNDADGLPSEAVAGGEPRGGVVQRTNYLGGRNAMRPGQPIAVDMVIVQNELRLRQIVFLRERRDGLTAQVESNNARLLDAKTNETDRAALRSSNDRLLGEIRMIDRQIRDIQTQHGGPRIVPDR